MLSIGGTIDVNDPAVLAAINLDPSERTNDQTNLIKQYVKNLASKVNGVVRWVRTLFRNYFISYY
jgi:hypothetical protein